MEGIQYIQIQGIHDGVCVEYNPLTKVFVWRDNVIQKTTEKYRNNFENKVLKTKRYENK